MSDLIITVTLLESINGDVNISIICSSPGREGSGSSRIRVLHLALLFFTLFVEFALLGCGVLVLLVLGFHFCEFILVHTLTGVPMEESFTPEHSGLFSSIPSPVYQWRKALHLNIAVYSRPYPRRCTNGGKLYT